MHVNAAGQHRLSAGIDDPGSLKALGAVGNGGDLAVLYRDAAGHCITGADDLRVFDKQVNFHKQTSFIQILETGAWDSWRCPDAAPFLQ